MSKQASYRQLSGTGLALLPLGVALCTLLTVPANPTLWPLPCPDCGQSCKTGHEMEMHLRRDHRRSKEHAAEVTVATLRAAQREAGEHAPSGKERGE